MLFHSICIFYLWSFSFSLLKQIIKWAFKCMIFILTFHRWWKHWSWQGNGVPHPLGISQLWMVLSMGRPTAQTMKMLLMTLMSGRYECIDKLTCYGDHKLIFSENYKLIQSSEIHTLNYKCYILKEYRLLTFLWFIIFRNLFCITNLYWNLLYLGERGEAMVVWLQSWCSAKEK